MAYIEKFLGQKVEIPEDRRYAPRQGLWAKQADQALVFGFTQPALVLLGGLKDMEWLVEDKQVVGAGDPVIFAITGKILYLETPVAGTIHFNPAAKKDLRAVCENPYGDGWLFSIEPAGDIDHALQALAPHEEYLDSLRGSEGFKNPEGLKGGVSGICKAVYSGIGSQKIGT